MMFWELGGGVDECVDTQEGWADGQEEEWKSATDRDGEVQGSDLG